MKEIVEKYANQGVRLLDESGDGTQFSIHLEADPQSAYDTINAFSSDVRKKAIELGNEHVFDDILDISSQSLNEAKSSIDKWGGIYKTSLLSQIALDDDLSKEYNKAIEAVEAYNEAVLKSEEPYNDKDVAKARQNLQSVSDELTGEEWQKYGSVVKEVFEEADTSLYDFNQALKNNEGLQKLANNLSTFDNVDLKALDENPGENIHFDKLKESADAYGISVNELINTLVRLGYVEGEISEVASTISELSFTDIMFQVEKLSVGLGQLSSIYADIMDGNDFDWSSIFNNDDFTETFGSLGNSYNNFIKTISSSPNNIEACQQAFDQLSAEYINQSGILNNLTEETRDATVAFLEQNGMANATAAQD